MWKCLFVALGLAFASTARSADAGGAEAPPVDAFSYGPLDDAKAKAEERRAAKQAEQEERDAELAEARSGRDVRVIALQWKGTDVDYRNATVQRNVRTRIARPDAKFYPSIDIYQVGRAEPRRDIRPEEERASVPDDNIGIVMNAVHDIETVPWNAMSESDWGITANQLRSLAEDQLWFIDRPDLREPLFQLYAQIGRAAENQNNSAPPFFANIGGQAVNYYWYRAGALAHETPDLLGSLSDQSTRGGIEYYKGLLDSGSLGKMKLAFEMGDEWNATQYNSEFTTFINGVQVEITDPDSLYKVPPGRIDIYLKRADGHSLSEQIVIDKLEDKVYFVRDTARKVMGYDLIDQLMEHPNECTPELTGGAWHYLTIYAKLHPESEIYVAVPEAGNPNKVLLWRFDRNTNTLQKVLDDSGGFPVRFVALGGIGAAFSGATLKPVDEAAADAYQECIDGLAAGDDPTTCGEAPEYAPELAASGIPIRGELRMHYGRLMVALGGEIAPSLGEEPYSDVYQTQGNKVVDSSGNEILKELAVNRLLYMGVGGVFLKDAALGIGPRAYGRFGWYNVPHMLDMTVHGGLTAEPPGMEGSGRVRTVIDVDGWIGAMVPFGQTNREAAVPTFGIAASGGITF